MSVHSYKKRVLDRTKKGNKVLNSAKKRNAPFPGQRYNVKIQIPSQIFIVKGLKKLSHACSMNHKQLMNVVKTLTVYRGRQLRSQLWKLRTLKRPFYWNTKIKMPRVPTHLCELHSGLLVDIDLTYVCVLGCATVLQPDHHAATDAGVLQTTPSEWWGVCVCVFERERVCLHLCRYYHCCWFLARHLSTRVSWFLAWLSM